MKKRKIDEDPYLQTDIEFDMDRQNPREIRIILKSPYKDMNGEDLYDALYCLVHDILEPDIFKDRKERDGGRH